MNFRKYKDLQMKQINIYYLFLILNPKSKIRVFINNITPQISTIEALLTKITKIRKKIFTHRFSSAIVNTISNNATRLA